MINDVVNKRQNYKFQKDSCGARIVYLDLGCSFVRCVDGFLTIPHKVEKALGSARRCDFRKLRGKYIPTADNSDLVSLEELVENLEELPVPVLNPSGTRSVGNLISREEIDTIRTYLECGLVASIPRYRELGLLNS